MTTELAKSFAFDSAHTLARTTADADASRRVHGHSYRCEIVLRGEPGPDGMLLDLARLTAAIAPVRDALDHRLLDDVPDLAPATLERLAAWIFARLHPTLPLLARVSVHRDGAREWASSSAPPPSGRGPG